MSELDFLQSSSEDFDTKAGIRSIKIENLGKLSEISEKTMIPVTQLVNYGVNILCHSFFYSGFFSEAYMELKKKAHQYPNKPLLEFDLIRIACEILAHILHTGIYDQLVQLSDKSAEYRQRLTLQRCVIEALRQALADPALLRNIIDNLNKPN